METQPFNKTKDGEGEEFRRQHVETKSQSSTKPFTEKGIKGFIEEGLGEVLHRRKKITPKIMKECERKWEALREGERRKRGIMKPNPSPKQEVNNLNSLHSEPKHALKVQKTQNGI